MLDALLDGAADRKEDVLVYGLALVALIAGASKFFEPGVWAAYEPGFIVALSPVDTTTHMYVAGVVESLAGILLLLRRRVFEVSGFLTLWLVGITASVLYLGFWSIALRDFGLVVLAAYTSLLAYSSTEEN